jgi:hypothetical protein
MKYRKMDYPFHYFDIFGNSCTVPILYEAPHWGPNNFTYPPVARSPEPGTQY